MHANLNKLTYYTLEWLSREGPVAAEEMEPALRFQLSRLRDLGWVAVEDGLVVLTPDGEAVAAEMRSLKAA